MGRRQGHTSARQLVRRLGLGKAGGGGGDEGISVPACRVCLRASRVVLLPQASGHARSMSKIQSAHYRQAVEQRLGERLARGGSRPWLAGRGRLLSPLARICFWWGRRLPSASERSRPSRAHDDDACLECTVGTQAGTQMDRGGAIGHGDSSAIIFACQVLAECPRIAGTAPTLSTWGDQSATCHAGRPNGPFGFVCPSAMQGITTTTKWGQ